MHTLANSEDPDEMQHYANVYASLVGVHQGQLKQEHYTVRKASKNQTLFFRKTP